MEDILFPHESIREGQKLLVEDVLDALKEKKHLLAYAPTGIGKTSILGPVLSFALKNNLDVFFLTSRHTQHKIAVDTLKKIKEKYGKDIQVLDIIGKKWLCIQQGVEALKGQQFTEYCKDLIEKGSCEFYNNTHDKKNPRVKQALGENGIMHVDELINLGFEKKLCPYELGLLKARKVNVVVADYSYIFNPVIRDNFFKKTDKSLNKSIVIVDEAHNLPERIRDLLSFNLSNFILDRALTESANYDEAREQILMIKNLFENLFENVKEERLVKKSELSFDDEILENLEVVADDVREIKKRSYIGSVVSFLDAWRGQDKGFTRILSKRIDKDKKILSLSYRCLDPGVVSSEVMESVYSVIGMSGTLTPVEMYSDLLSMKGCLKREYQ